MWGVGCRGKTRFRIKCLFHASSLILSPLSFPYTPHPTPHTLFIAPCPIY
ncbi:MAG: hypothetical protein F6J93_33395 [Oscillatoria sp. SIO1A7]|nr:hypothetical protein [Oscillatoria sp. SIO1A7]